MDLRVRLIQEYDEGESIAGFGIPSLNVDTGTATTFLNPVSTTVKPRIIRLGLKIIF